MSLKWTRVGEKWLAIEGQFRAEVRRPTGPLGFCHWSVRAGDRPGGAGGTSSLAESKREAARELERFKNYLRQAGKQTRKIKQTERPAHSS